MASGLSEPALAPDLLVDPIVAEVLSGVDERLLATSEGRRVLCEVNPLLFALLYLPDTLRNSHGHITLAPVHREWCELAKECWLTPSYKPAEHRYALLAPRGCGKSSWFYLLIPMWLLAYGHTKFIAAFAHSDHQAQLHLQTWKDALKNRKNAALRQDFPELVRAKQNKEGIYVARSGVIFAAKGIDSQALGMKVGDQRPDTILLDDIEPDSGNYSAYQMEKRRESLQDAILPLNTEARVVMTGTVTMPGSITHQCIQYNKGYSSRELEWVGLEKIKVRHTLPFVNDPTTGEEISFWPTNPKFDYQSMNEKRHTREFMKNYMNDPMAVDSEYWTLDDFHYDEFPVTRAMISIDGAVTTKKESDFTGVAVIGYQPPEYSKDGEPIRRSRCLVMFCQAVKLRGDRLRDYVLKLCERFPEVNGILVESNQGGQLWEQTFHNMPVPVRSIHQSERKEERAGQALNFYQMRPPRVYHAKKLHELEQQMVTFPQGLHDDLVDAAGTGILAYLKPRKNNRPGAMTKRPR